MVDDHSMRRHEYLCPPSFLGLTALTWACKTAAGTAAAAAVKSRIGVNAVDAVGLL